jgi:hypothetical protein
LHAVLFAAGTEPPREPLFVFRLFGIDGTLLDKARPLAPAPGWQLEAEKLEAGSWTPVEVVR